MSSSFLQFNLLLFVERVIIIFHLLFDVALAKYVDGFNPPHSVTAFKFRVYSASNLDRWCGFDSISLDFYISNKRCSASGCDCLLIRHVLTQPCAATLLTVYSCCSCYFVNLFECYIKFGHVRLVTKWQKRMNALASFYMKKEPFVCFVEMICDWNVYLLC